MDKSESDSDDNNSNNSFYKFDTTKKGYIAMPHKNLYRMRAHVKPTRRSQHSFSDHT